ncbi:zinc finger protein [Macleaya cordata]|uniref:Zinc finger protein n=1 Tax=Macleaya cordata TaxID=56857 RepID=A0A200Q122_MACCD|nr:zinc finger protein [Macleaya cordata]
MARGANQDDALAQALREMTEALRETRTTNPLEAENWLAALEKRMDFLRVDDMLRVDLAVYLLTEEANHWWSLTKRTKEREHEESQKIHARKRDNNRKDSFKRQRPNPTLGQNTQDKNGDNSQPKKCYECGQAGHIRKHCPRLRQQQPQQGQGGQYSRPNQQQQQQRPQNQQRPTQPNQQGRAFAAVQTDDDVSMKA